MIALALKFFASTRNAWRRSSMVEILDGSLTTKVGALSECPGMNTH
jgi:hypothetical protein